MLAMMLLGIALYKIGFFTGQWSRKQYLRALLVGYGLGLPTVIFSRIYYMIHMPDIPATIAYFEAHAIDWVALLYDFQRILIMMAHVSLFILIYKAGYLKWLMKALNSSVSIFALYKGILWQPGKFSQAFNQVTKTTTHPSLVIYRWHG